MPRFRADEAGEIIGIVISFTLLAVMWIIIAVCCISLVFCCIRLILLSSRFFFRVTADRCRAAQRSSGDVIQGGGENFPHDPASRRSGVELPYPHLPISEPPPAYENSVATAVIFPTGTESRSLHGNSDVANQRLLFPMLTLPSSAIFRPDGNADEDAEKSPPPSYQEATYR